MKKVILIMFFSTLSVNLWAASHQIDIQKEMWIGSPQSIVELIEFDLMQAALKSCKEPTTPVSISNVKITFEGSQRAEPINFSGQAGAGYMQSFITLAMPKVQATAIVNCTEDATYLE